MNANNIGTVRETPIRSLAVEIELDVEAPAIGQSLHDRHAGRKCAECRQARVRGIGLPEDRERLTEPYMTTRVRGTGLGLAIVKKIVEEHMGEIAFLDRPGGGTHVRMTGEIGPVLITGIERAKKQTRIEFICGNRVLQYARQANYTLAGISQTISAAPFDTATAVRTLWDEHQKLRKQVEDLESQLLDYEAGQFPVTDGLAVAVFKNRGIEKLKMLATKICARPNTVALLADEGDQLRVVFARSADSTVDVAALLKKTLERFGGRGGGRPNLAQGGGLNGAADEILKFAKEMV